MEQFDIPHLNTSVHIWLFTKVKNLSQIRTSLIEVSKLNETNPNTVEERNRLDWCFLNPSMITSSQHLNTAIYQALLARSQHQLKTKTIYSEIMWTLSPGTNITESIKKFGIDPKSDKLILIKITETLSNETEKQLSSIKLNQLALKLIEGELISINEINSLNTDWNEVCKVYKLNEDLVIKEFQNTLKNQTSDLEEFHEIIDRIVTSTVAFKSVAG
ncbi:kinase binding protein CGI-121-domain-containing protein [Melampsora americana]|nr:kinase binding protein CGI-121-domain-containing protein [Melampsora americana]